MRNGVINEVIKSTAPENAYALKLARANTVSKMILSESFCFGFFILGSALCLSRYRQSVVVLTSFSLRDRKEAT